MSDLDIAVYKMLGYKVRHKRIRTGEWSGYQDYWMQRPDGSRATSWHYETPIGSEERL